MASDTELWRGTDYGWWLAADTSGAVGASLIAFAVPLMMLATTGSSAAATTTESICATAAKRVKAGKHHDQKSLQQVRFTELGRQDCRQGLLHHVRRLVH